MLVLDAAALGQDAAELDAAALTLDAAELDAAARAAGRSYPEAPPVLALDANALGQNAADLAQGTAARAARTARHRCSEAPPPVPERDADGLRDRTPIEPPGAPLSPHAPPARARA